MSICHRQKSYLRYPVYMSDGCWQPVFPVVAGITTIQHCSLRMSRSSQQLFQVYHAALGTTVKQVVASSNF